MTWAPVLTLKELAQGGLFSDGDWVESKDQDPQGSVRLTQLADVGVGEFRDRSDRWLRSDQAERLNCTYLEPGDVLIARMPDPIGRACQAPTGLGDAVTAVDVAVLRIRRNDVDPRYVMWAVNSPRFHSRVVLLQSGTTRKRISRKNLATLDVPVPPLDEQRRIVEILEDLLSRLDVAERSLIGSLRQARRMSTASLGAQLSRPRGDAWRDSTVGGEALLVEYGSSAKTGPPSQTTDIPVLRMGNIKDGAIDWTSLKYLPQGHSDFPKLLLQPGDLLFNRTNSAEHVGKSAVFDEVTVSSFASYLIRVRLGNDVDPRWANMIINSPQGRRYVGSVVSQQVGQANVNGTKLKAFPLPVPPIDQQLRRIAAHKGVVDAAARLNREVSEARVRADGLRNALLTAAFSGRLTGHARDAELIEEMAGV